MENRSRPDLPDPERTEESAVIYFASQASGISEVRWKEAEHLFTAAGFVHIDEIEIFPVGGKKLRDNPGLPVLDPGWFPAPPAEVDRPDS